MLPGFKPDVEALARTRGLAEAWRLFELSRQAVLALEALIAEEVIECGYVRCGTVVLAARPGHLAALARSRQLLRDQLGHETTLLGPSELAAEIGSTRYHGGLLDRARGIGPAGGAGARTRGGGDGTARGSARGRTCGASCGMLEASSS